MGSRLHFAHFELEFTVIKLGNNYQVIRNKPILVYQYSNRSLIRRLSLILILEFDDVLFCRVSSRRLYENLRC